MTKNRDKIETDLELFRDLTNKTNDAIFVNDPQTGRFIFVNNKACTSLGYDRKELLKMNFMDIETTFPDNFSWQTHVDKLREGGSYMLEGIHKRKDGTTFPVEANVSYLVLNTREYMVAVVRDITEISARKLTEESLRESEERLSLALRAAGQSIYDSNLKTGEAIVSPEYALMLGYDPAEFHETTAQWIKRLHPDDRESVAAVYRAYIKGGIPEYKVEFRQKTKDGNWKWVLSLGKIIERDADGNPLRMIGTHTDITERKARENALVAAAEEAQLRTIELAKKNMELDKVYTELKQTQSQLIQREKIASIGELAAGVAHEIKNPLGIIVQGIDFIKGQLADNQLADASERIKKAALRADNIVKNLLSFARQSHPTLEKKDIVPIIEETLSLVEHQLNLKNIRIIRRFEEGTPMAVVDSNQLKQVFINVLLNAAYAMRQGGIIEIDVGKTVTPAGKPAIRISFSDNGCGIEPENIEKVFDPFFTTKRDSGGTGLGLSVSHRIIEHHSGTLSIESRVGEGTRVLVTLPAPEQ